MKIDKKDIPKILLLLGVLIIGIGIILCFTNKKEKKVKVDWKNSNYEKEEIPSEEIPVEVITPEPGETGDGNDEE